MNIFDENTYRNTIYAGDWKYALRQYDLAMETFGHKRRSYLLKALDYLQNIPEEICKDGMPTVIPQRVAFAQEIQKTIDSRKSLSLRFADIAAHVKKRLTQKKYYANNIKWLTRILSVSYILLLLDTLAWEVNHIRKHGTAPTKNTTGGLIATGLLLAVYLLPLWLLTSYYAKSLGRENTHIVSLLFIVHHVFALAAIILTLVLRLF